MTADDEDMAVAARALSRWQAGGPLVDPDQDLLDAHVKAEEARAFGRACPKCQAPPGAWCDPAAALMHYERWGYVSLR